MYIDWLYTTSFFLFAFLTKKVVDLAEKREVEWERVLVFSKNNMKGRKGNIVDLNWHEEGSQSWEKRVQNSYIIIGLLKKIH